MSAKERDRLKIMATLSEGRLKQKPGRLGIHVQRQPVSHRIEFKTVSTNWRMDGIQIKFPVPIADNRWLVYLDRIGSATGVPLSDSRHCMRVSIGLNDGSWRPHALHDGLQPESPRPRPGLARPHVPCRFRPTESRPVGHRCRASRCRSQWGVPGRRST